MAIYDRWYSKLEIWENCGKHKVKGFPAPLTLVKIKLVDSGLFGYLFAEFLRADGGLSEIVDEVNRYTVSKVELNEPQLSEALQEAL